METDSPVVYHGTSESRFPRTEELQKAVSELTAEEKDLLKQCNKESLYYRCLPFAVVGMAATHFAARKGFIKPHPVWGTTFSMSGSALLGWIIGKFSYRSKCEEKFLRLENSSIGEMVRKKRGYVLDRYRDFSKSQTFEDDLTRRDDPSFSYRSDSDYHSSTGSLNLDVDKNIQYSGLDDRERPSTDREPMATEYSGPVRNFTTYEDLRRRNREENARLQRSPERSELSRTAGESPWGNVDSTPARRYSSDYNEGDSRRNESYMRDNAKVL